MTLDIKNYVKHAFHMSKHGATPWTPDLNEPKLSEGDRVRSARYNKEFTPAIIVYAIGIAVATSMGYESTTARVLMSTVIPIVPFALGSRAVLRSYRRADEFERLQILKGIALGFGVAMFVALLLGCMAAVKVHVPRHADGWLIWGAGMGTWAVASIIERRRY